MDRRDFFAHLGLGAATVGASIGLTGKTPAPPAGLLCDFLISESQEKCVLHKWPELVLEGESYYGVNFIGALLWKDIYLALGPQVKDSLLSDDPGCHWAFGLRHPSFCSGHWLFIGGILMEKTILCDKVKAGAFVVRPLFGHEATEGSPSPEYQLQHLRVQLMEHMINRRYERDDMGNHVATRFLESRLANERTILKMM